jgi:hypothetical protein
MMGVVDNKINFCGVLQFIGLVDPLPGEVIPSAAKMSVRCGGPVDRPEQIEMLIMALGRRSK